MHDYEQWFERLEGIPSLSQWVGELRSQRESWFSEGVRSDLVKWKGALAQLPEVQDSGFSVEDGLLKFAPLNAVSEEALKAFHPWRKGPFQIGEHYVNTEWRSDWKWERVATNVDLEGKKVLDIGCGNGYYLWRMLEAGAEWALGIDPYLPYVMQFKSLQHFAGGDSRAEIFPIGVEALPKEAKAFDIVFSMGVLYHQRSPLEHLAHCRDLTVKGGSVILDTIVLPPHFSEVTDCLVPEGRYAKMKNVNFLPSVEMLKSWLKKLRFTSVEVLDYSKTTLEEQRSTDWMTFESLPDFLDPADNDKTLEGYPAPWRVVLKAIA